MRSIIPIIFIALSIAGAFIYVKPLYTDVTNLRADASSYNTALSNSKNLQKTRDNLIASYKSISNENKDRLSRFLPNSVNNIQLILEIQQIASKHGLSIKNISFKPPEDNAVPAKEDSTTKTTSKTAKPKDVSLFGTFDLDFKTSSDYDTFTLFVTDLEQNLRLIDVVGVDFAVPVNKLKGNVDFDPNIYDFSVKIKTYWLK